MHCTKTVFGRGSATDPAGEGYDAPPDLWVGLGRPLSISPSRPSASRSVSLLISRFASYPLPNTNSWLLDYALYALLSKNSGHATASEAALLLHLLKTCAHCRRKVKLSPLSRRFLRQSHFCATVWTGLKAAEVDRETDRQTDRQRAGER